MLPPRRRLRATVRFGALPDINRIEMRRRLGRVQVDGAIIGSPACAPPFELAQHFTPGRIWGPLPFRLRQAARRSRRVALRSPRTRLNLKIYPLGEMSESFTARADPS
jgi:hypothetical protein